MKAVQKHFGMAALLVSCAAAQTGTTPQAVTAVRDGENLRVEITLSAPIKPTNETAVHPDRILLDFPATASDAETKGVEVNANGVRKVRIGRHSESPLITRVVIDLDQPHPYIVTAEGTRIFVTIAPPKNSRATRGAPAAATTGNLIGIFSRRHDSKPALDEPTDIPQTPAPPPAVAGPGFEPPAETQRATAVAQAQVAPAPPSSKVTAVPEVAAKQDSPTPIQIDGPNSGVSTTIVAST